MPLAGVSLTVEAPPAPLPPELSAEDREALLDVARAALAAATGVRPVTVLERALAAAHELPAGSLHGSAFVTLLAHGELRACMGTRDPAASLPDSVAQAALSAACADPRFWPLRAGELATLEAEISILGSLADLPDPRLLEAGRDGVVVQRDGSGALLLPEVAISHAWDGPRLLEACCEKAGLSGDAWRDPATRLRVFRTVRFGGPALRPDPAG